MRDTAERRHLDSVAVEKQIKIFKSHLSPEDKRACPEIAQPHRLAKHHGGAGMYKVANPRKSTRLNEQLTVHEKSTIEVMNMDLHYLDK